MTTLLINRPCTITTRTFSGSSDQYGNDIPTEATRDTVCEVQPRSAVEPENQNELSDEQWTGFFLPDDADYLDSASEVIVSGMGAFELEGQSSVWRNPRTALNEYVQANLRRTIGPDD